MDAATPGAEPESAPPPSGSRKAMSELAGKPASARDYAALSAGWASLLGAVLVASRDCGDDHLRAQEAVWTAVATFALSKLIAKEKVAAWAREPFVEQTDDGRR